MEQRAFGTTGLQVSALGFGCGAVGGLMTRGEPADQVAAARHAIEAGVTYFDTAAMYGNGASERNLGRVLRELGAWGSVRVGTKLRLNAADLPDPAAAVHRYFDDSLGRLAHDSVDLMQLHNRIGAATHPDGDMLGGEQLEAVIGAMRDEVSRGRCRFIGCTGLGETATLHAVVARRAFDSVQCYFNALNPSGGFAGAAGGSQDFAGLIDAAKAQGMGTIGIRVMAAGALAGDVERAPLAGNPGGAIGGSAYEADVDRTAKLQRLASDLGLESALELGLRFALAKDGLCTALVGYSDFAQLEAALRWTERGPLTPEAAAKVIALAGS